MKRFLIIILLLGFIQITKAQENLILRSNGQIEKNGEVIKSADGKRIKPVSKEVNDRINSLISSNQKSLYLADTLFNAFPQTGNSNFGFFGQDWLVQWFEAPSDMIIRAAGYNCNAIDSLGIGGELKLIKLNWTKDEILAATSFANHWGYYEAEGNGFNDITAFQDNPDITGNWVSTDTTGMGSPFGEDLWSDNGLGAPITPVPSGEVNKWAFVQMNLLGFEPEVQDGDIIGVAIKNTSTKMDDDRIGMLANNTLGLGGFKFYTNGRLDPGGPGVGDPGWWSRLFTWDFALAVEILSRPYYSLNPTRILWDVNNDPKEIFASIDIFNDQVDSINLQYSVNGANFINIKMTLDSVDGYSSIYKATIPSQSPGDNIEYKISGMTLAGDQIISASRTYGIYQPKHPTLIIWQPLGTSRINQLTPYYNQDVMGDWDHFFYNEVSIELLSYYNRIIEIETAESGLRFKNRENITEWLSQGAREYMLVGDEFLGYWSNWKDSVYIPGDFEYEVLGLSQSYNDIHDNNNLISTSIMYPIENTMLGDTLYNHLISESVDTLKYDPIKTLGSSASNWLDGFEMRTDLTNAEIFMKGIGDDSLKYNIGISHTPNDDKIVFMSFDPLSLHGIRNINSDTIWVSNSTKTPFQQTVLSGFFSELTKVIEENNIKPSKYSLEQNYPNPFNPETTIKFSIPVSENVTLKIYDVLGKEVKTLINDNLEAGSYTTSFNGNELASGIYIYRLTAGSFTSSKKMLLLK